MRLKTTRKYCHRKGLTYLSVDFTSNCFITCGNDTDVRIWRDIDDDDVMDFTVDQPGTCVGCHGDTFYTSSSIIKAYNKTTGKPHDGFVTKFTLPVTHFVLNSTGEKMLVASSEVGVIRLVNLADLRYVTLGHEHEAPVISLAWDPLEKFIASASGDGSVRIWSFPSGDSVKILPNLLMKTNDIRIDRPLARICWHPTGKFLAIPIRDGVQLYERNGDWNVFRMLRYRPTGDVTNGQRLNENREQQDEAVWFSVLSFSRCGKYLVAGSLNGKICIWDVDKGDLLLTNQLDSHAHITSIAWDPVRQCEILYCDADGMIGALKELDLDRSMGDRPLSPHRRSTKHVDDIEDEEFSINQKILGQHRRPKVTLDDEDAETDIGALKAFYNTQIGLDEKGEPIEQDALSNDGSVEDILDTEKPRAPTQNVLSLKSTPPQAPFIVGSMPEDFSERYMKWNAEGIVKQYNSEGDNSIEVRYHDTSLHHQFIVDNNVTRFTLADLSSEAVAMASRGPEGSERTDKSQLRVTYLKSWDNATKDWTIDAPEGECIQGICLGNGWVAFATSARIVRVITIAGLQRHLFTIPGPIVTMCGNSNRLAIVYHDGMGLDGDQCLSYAIYKVQLNTIKCGDIQGNISCETGRLPISQKSTLVWMGFMPNGVLASADSDGIIRVLNRAYHSSWLQICDIRQHVKSRSEFAWIVSIRDDPAQIRCIICKSGSRYPALSPKPSLTIIDWQIPLCDTGADLIGPESNLVLNEFRKGYCDMTFDEQDATRTEIETITKLFLMSCKSERDCRSLEIARLIPTSQSLQPLIRHAVAQKRHVLAQKIAEIASRKAEEEEVASMRKIGPATHSPRLDQNDSDDDLISKLTDDDIKKTTPKTESRVIKLKKKPIKDRIDEPECSTNKSPSTIFGNPKSATKNGASGMEVAPNGKSADSKAVNPFKKMAPGSDTAQALPPGVSVFDTVSPSWINKKRSGDAVESVGPVNGEKKLKADTNGAEGKSQHSRKPKSGGKSILCNKTEISTLGNNESDKVNPQAKSGFTLWMEEYEDELLLTMPTSNDDGTLLKHAMSQWRQLNASERQRYTDKAKMLNSVTVDETETVSLSID